MRDAVVTCAVLAAVTIFAQPCSGAEPYIQRPGRGPH